MRGPTAERKKSRTNWKNINKKPNPAKQEKAEAKRDRRRKRNIRQLRNESWGNFYGRYFFKDIWIYGMPSVRQDFKKLEVSEKTPICSPF